MAKKDNNKFNNIEIVDIVDLSNNFVDSNKDFKKKKNFLRKGQGKLASHNHGITNFSLNRKNSFIFDQNKNEEDCIRDNVKSKNFIK